MTSCGIPFVWPLSRRTPAASADPTPPDGRPDALRKPGKARWALDLLAAGWTRALTYLRGANFYKAKLSTARYFAQHQLPQAGGLAAAITGGSSSVLELPESLF